MSCRELEYLKEASQFWDNRNSRGGLQASGASHFRYRKRFHCSASQQVGSRSRASYPKQTGELNGRHNQLGVNEDFRRSRTKDGDVAGDDAFLHDRPALFNLIKTCTKQKDLRTGSLIHADILERGLLKYDISLGNALLSMYAKCGAIAKVQELFDNLPARNIVTWNGIISAYAHHGLGDRAFSLFGRIRDEGLSPNAVTYMCILKACSWIGAVEKGEEIHAEIGRQGLLKEDVKLGTALVDMYAKCGALEKARGVFDVLPVRNVTTWTALIAGYAQHGLAHEALNCFCQMQDEGLSPDAVTFICISKACGSIGAIEKGKEIHAEVDKQGLLEKDIVLGTALVDMYAKCGDLVRAQRVFDKIPARNVTTWTALILGYTQHGLADKALSCFGQMRDEGLSPDAVTFVCILQACGSVGAAAKGEKIHVEIDRRGLLEKDIVLGNALVDMYAKCGALASAQGVFNKLPVRNVTTWTSLISGYAQHGLGDEALSWFGRMEDEGLFPNAITYICTLKACGSIGAFEKGKAIHAEVSRQGLLEKDLVLGTTLVDMYAKCGALAKAQGVFDTLPAPNVATWTALISGYGQVGMPKTVFDSFMKMIRQGIEPNEVTFVVLLTACSHAGLVEEGKRILDTMSTVYCITPTLEHHTCMVDVYSRAGQFDKAICIIEKVSPSDRLLMLSALMGACRERLNIELGMWAFEHAIKLDQEFAATYVCMSNMYLAAGMQEEGDDVEVLRIKVPGRCWWTDVRRNIHSFTVGDPQSNFMYAKLEDIDHRIQLEGYSSHLHWVSQAVSDFEEEDVQCGHSEKLGITYALINTPEGTPIRLTKNMRVCGDCHIATSLISKMEKRKIQVTAADRVHIFEDGKCTCE